MRTKLIFDLNIGKRMLEIDNAISNHYKCLPYRLNCILCQKNGNAAWLHHHHLKLHDFQCYFQFRKFQLEFFQLKLFVKLHISFKYSNINCKIGEKHAPRMSSDGFQWKHYTQCDFDRSLTARN